MTEVRAARSEDLGPVIEMLVAAQGETGYAGLRVDQDKMHAVLSRMLATEDACVLVLVTDSTVNSTIDGVMFGVCQEYWFGPDRVAMDMMLYARPSARSGVFIKRMVERFEEWALSRGAKRVMLAVSSAVDIERKGRLLHHFGYDALGGLYGKEV